MCIAPGLLRDAGAAVRALLPSPSSRVFVVSCAPVLLLWGKKLQTSLRKAGVPFDVIGLPDGERHKRIATVEQILDELAARGADRTSLVLAFGGGVICDMAGFAASIYMRGVPVVQVPTTLLAQVDAAIGGKTGVNLATGKNLAGTFYQPLAVLADTDVLRTLPEREFRAGLFEAIKCGVISDPRLFALLEKQRKSVLAQKRGLVAEVITRSVRVKARVVSADETESGLRRVLNFGHTVGHALEAAGGYRKLLHGEAVGLGMIAATYMAMRMGLLARASGERIRDLVLAYGPLPRVEFAAEQIVARLAGDKKSVGGVPHFVLPTRIGQVEIVAGVPPELVTDAVAGLRRLRG